MFPEIPRGSEDQPVPCPPCAASAVSPPHPCGCRGVRSGTGVAQAPLARPSLLLVLCRDLKIWRRQSHGGGLHSLYCVLWPHTAVLCLSSPQDPTPPFQGLSSPFVGGCSCSGSVGWGTLSFQMCLFKQWLITPAHLPSQKE